MPVGAVSLMNVTVMVTCSPGFTLFGDTLRLVTWNCAGDVSGKT